jgi:hypothetical protein
MVADALLAVFLGGLLAARFRWWLTYSPPASAADIRLFSRGLSRLVYLALYLIIGARQIVNIVGRLYYEGGPAPDLGILTSTSQVFLLHGLMALVLIRVLAYLTWRRYRFSLDPCAPIRSSAASTARSFPRPY